MYLGSIQFSGITILQLIIACLSSFWKCSIYPIIVLVVIVLMQQVFSLVPIQLRFFVTSFCGNNSFIPVSEFFQGYNQ